MSAYRTIVTVGEPGQIHLTGVPVQIGEQVEVVVRPCDADRQRRVQKLQALLSETQSLPQVETISKAEIAAEVTGFRIAKVISRDPEILGGTPVFAGTRVPIDSLLAHLKAEDTLDTFLADFPSVSHYQAEAVLDLAADLILAEK